MLAKYKIDYAIPFHSHDEPHHYLTNDPVSGEEFLSELLERGLKIKGISHEGVALPNAETDMMIKTAAGIMAARHICRSLGIDSVEARHRFGSTA